METVYAIQHSILLPCYFFHLGRMQDGQEQSQIAVSLALDSGMYLNRTPSACNVEHTHSMTYPQDVALGHDSFWAALRQHYLWSGILGYSAAVPYDNLQHVSVPWPHEVTQGASVGTLLFPQIDEAGLTSARVFLKIPICLAVQDILDGVASVVDESVNSF